MRVAESASVLVGDHIDADYGIEDAMVVKGVYKNLVSGSWNSKWKLLSRGTYVRIPCDAVEERAAHWPCILTDEP